ncbi:MAG: hypothetical protein ACLTC1_08870 [Turicibacter sp.]
MQLAQYVSTIATSGRRYAPQIVKMCYLQMGSRWKAIGEVV